MFKSKTASLLLALAVLAPGQAIPATYGAGIENSQWYLSESVFGCSLTQDVPGYGKAVFNHRAGESLTFYLESDVPLMKPGRGMVVVEAPTWRPGVAPRSVGAVMVDDGQRPVSLNTRATMTLVQGLLDGMAPTVTRDAWYGGDPVRVRVSNINFAANYSAYRQCVGGLLPVNYDQIKRSRIPFGVSSSELGDADRQLLDNIAIYVLADTTVERIFVDGHSDRYGSRITNRALSEERANAVAQYLIAQGVAEDMITVRAHGDRFPASSRAADNRRATIRLQRQGERPDLQQANGYGGAQTNG